MTDPAAANPSPASVPFAVMRAMRPWQWAKNLLVFLPFLLAHNDRSWHMFIEVLMGFIAFCLLAGAGYLFNDLKDLQADRQHAEKCRRPLASGQLSPRHAILAALICGFIGLALAAAVSFSFLICLLLYLFLTLAYSTYLKRKPVVDVIVLAGLYTLRVLAGAAATGLPRSESVSFWLLAFSMFIFLSLALVKRLAELKILESTDQPAPLGRGYRTSDLALLRSAGPAAGYLAVLVFALYINSEKVRLLYPRPDILWLACPVLLYWITRVWLLADRGNIHEDPIAWAIRDKISYVTVAIIVALAILAKL